MKNREKEQGMGDGSKGLRKVVKEYEFSITSSTMVDMIVSGVQFD